MTRVVVLEQTELEGTRMRGRVQRDGAGRRGAVGVVGAVVEQALLAHSPTVWIPFIAFRPRILYKSNISSRISPQSVISEHVPPF